VHALLSMQGREASHCWAHTALHMWPSGGAVIQSPQAPTIIFESSLVSANRAAGGEQWHGAPAAALPSLKSASATAAGGAILTHGNTTLVNSQ
jgi:hypothetical protein